MNQVRLMYGMDVLAGLKKLETESVHCIVTSPPYWGLRDYDVKGQIGLEATPWDWLDKMAAVFSECMRVLWTSGTMWINIGDTYNAQAGQQNLRQSIASRRGGAVKCSKTAFRLRKRAPAGVKRKELIGLPWRLALRLQEQGWYLRSEIIWHKPNPMPESVADRPTRAHEQIFLFTKSPKYWYNAEAIAEPAVFGEPNSPESIKSPYGQGFSRRARAVGGWQSGEGNHSAAGFNRPDANGGRKKYKKNEGGSGSSFQGHSGYKKADGSAICGDTRNKRSVWSIPTQAYPHAHFATFPEEIPRLCISAGCPPNGTVLDPFSGSGTTGQVAVKLGRRYIGIDLNQKYHELARQRIGIFACV